MFLASQVSLHPCINLVIYVVPCENAPLHIYSKSGHKSSTANNVEAFISPRWGGVVIANPSIEQCIKETEDTPIEFVPEEATVMGVFVSQLRLLLGVHELVRFKNQKKLTFHYYCSNYYFFCCCHYRCKYLM